MCTAVFQKTAVILRTQARDSTGAETARVCGDLRSRKIEVSVTDITRRFEFLVILRKIHLAKFKMDYLGVDSKKYHIYCF